ncbi:MAG: hypothetical protein HC905_11240 [Bacteroidales bacterium]|nr:hypothetical protein [Bacteroidales bacterium]
MKTTNTLICILLLFTATSLFAQNNFTEGYVITWQNDTIHGKIRERSPFMADDLVELKNMRGTVIKFTSRDIKGYSKSGIVHYIIIDNGWKQEFARIINDGEIKLLLIRRKSTTTSSTDMSGLIHSGDSYIKEEYYLFNVVNKQLTRVWESNFKTKMADYFSDYAELRNLILNKELRYNDLEIVVAKYNTWKRDQNITNEI